MYLSTKKIITQRQGTLSSPSAVALGLDNVGNKERYVTFQIYLEFPYAVSDF
jgi:hypothetical protein